MKSINEALHKEIRAILPPALNQGEYCAEKLTRWVMGRELDARIAQSKKFIGIDPYFESTTYCRKVESLVQGEIAELYRQKSELEGKDK
jgi:hypothetical protein